MNNQSLLKLLLCAALALAARSQLLAQSAPKTAPVVAGMVARASNAELRQQTFEIVWGAVNEKHFDPTFGGVNWQQMRARYAPQVAAAQSYAEMYQLLRQMLGELRQSHFNIIAPEAVVEDEAGKPAGGESGLQLRLIAQQMVISRVVPGSPAAQAGLRAGFVLKQLGNTTVLQLSQKLEKSTESAALKRLRLERMAQARLDGEPGSAIGISFLDDKDRLLTASVARRRFSGQFSPAFGNFPPQPIEFEAKRLPSGVGYIRFNIFVLPMMEKIRAAIREMKDAPGLIFDLRGNPGGLGGMAAGIAGHLYDEQTAPPGQLSLGKMQMRAGYTNFAIFPQALHYTGPLAIIIDGGSASTSEVFASGLQELGRAVVVGERSAGAALPSIFQKLPTGALFQYAIGDFKTPRGTLIEGRGVLPDVPVTLTRASLLAGRDAPLDAALAALHKRSRATKN
jgi:carboxyl-terminal processing protease